MTTDSLMEDAEIYFAALHERGRGGRSNGMSDTGTGDRATAERGRVGGHDRVVAAIGHVRDALRAGGWDGSSPLSATVTTGDHDAAGREWSLRGALADATVVAAADRPDADAADAAFHDEGVPDGAVSFSAGEGSVSARVAYISDGSASRAVGELAGVLRAAGIQTSEGG